MNILVAIIIGAIIGALARLILPGRQAIGWILTIVVGIVAAIIGNFVGEAIGIDGGFLLFLVQLVVAVIGVAIVAGIMRSSRSA